MKFHRLLWHVNLEVPLVAPLCCCSSTAVQQHAACPDGSWALNIVGEQRLYYCWLNVVARCLRPFQPQRPNRGFNISQAAPWERVPCLRAGAAGVTTMMFMSVAWQDLIPDDISFKAKVKICWNLQKKKKKKTVKLNRSGLICDDLLCWSYCSKLEEWISFKGRMLCKKMPVTEIHWNENSSFLPGFLQNMS